MIVKEFRIKKVVTNKAELIRLNTWDHFVDYYHIQEETVTSIISDSEEFVIDPRDAAMFRLLPMEEAEKLEDFYSNQLI